MKCYWAKAGHRYFTCYSQAMRLAIAFPALFGALLSGAGQTSEPLPLFDAHIHYSQPAWQQYPPAEVARIFDQAGISQALVSSTPNDGTEKLHDAMPGRVVPELRPYRSRDDMASWYRDPAIISFIEERLKKGIYRGIGEFHLHGDDAKSEVVKQVVNLAAARGLILHAHSDERAVEHLITANPKARVLWAHAGMSSSAEEVGKMLERHRNLWVELAIRSDVAPGGRLDPAWRALFLKHPDRILVGTDTWVASRWDEVVPLAQTTRQWLAELPRDTAEKIAYKNAAELFGAP